MSKSCQVGTGNSTPAGKCCALQNADAYNAPMRILLTNDDGIYAPGLRALRKELQSLGEVLVVAPATEQSAAGHSITLVTPLLVNEVFEDDGTTLLGWAVEGRPADCVKLALLELLPGPPDLIISGLNAGS